MLEASLLYRDQLSQSGQAAILLGQAAEIAPQDLGIARELAHLHSIAGRPALAVEQLGARARSSASSTRSAASCCCCAPRRSRRPATPKARSPISKRPSTLDAQRVAPQLEGVLEERRRAARSANDAERERAATLRLIDVLVSQQKISQSRKALSEWLARSGGDVAALRRSLELCEVDGDALGVAETAVRIVALCEGEEQLSACQLLVKTATRIERFDLALAGLETALRAQPDHLELRAALKEIYQQTGAFQELAQLLLEDATRVDTEPELASLLKQAGQYFLQAGQSAQALHTLRDALACAPSDTELLFLLADAYIDAGELSIADGLLGEWLPKLNGRPELYQHAMRKARLAEAAGDQKVQLAWLIDASKYEKDPHLVLTIANLAEALEDWDNAEKALRNVLLTKEDSPIGRSELYVRQARVWMFRGDNKRALMLARKAQKEEPDSAQVITLLQQLGAA